MSVLFYRRPDYLNKPDGPINTADCQKYAERAKNAERIIPPGLSFDEVMNNKALPVSDSICESSKTGLIDTPLSHVH